MQFLIRAATYLFLLFLAFAASFAALTMHAAAAGPVEGVHYDKKTDALTVHVQDMPLSEILESISAASGLKLSIQADLNRPVTMDLTAVPLDKAIRRLVQPNSSAMIYSKKEDGAVVLTSVKIYDKGESLSSSTANIPPPRRFNRRNDVSSPSGDSNPSIGNAGSAGGNTGRQGGSARNSNSRKNRGRQGGAVSGSGSQTTDATGATGSQSASDASSFGGGGRSR